jgi:hypothetical protein
MSNKLYGIDTERLTDKSFRLIRSDTGDGGWSIHWKYDEDEDGIPSQILVSGEATWLSQGEWSRPNAEDYADAIEVLLQRNGKPK